MKTSILSVCVLCVLQGMSAESAFAEESEAQGNQPDSITQRKVSLGVNSSSGNSDNLSVNGSLSFSHYKQRWTHDVDAEASYLESNDVKSADRMALSYSLGYVIAPGKYLFNLASYVKDTRYNSQVPDGLETRTYYDVFGYGFPIAESDSFTMDGMVGIGGRKKEYIFADQEEDEVIGHLGLNTAWSITSNTQFSNQLVLQPGKDNNYAEMTNAVTVSISEKFSLRLSRSDRYNSDPPAVYKKHDSQTSVNLVVDF